MYVDNLIAKDTVNTVPPQTLMQFADHGSTAKRMSDDLDDAEETLDMLAEVGVDLDQITHQLQVDGVEAFADAFENLLGQVDAKRNVLRTGIIRQQEVVLSIHTEAVRDAIAELERRFINTRIWEKDATVWKTNNLVIRQIRERLGWLDVDRTIDRARLRQLQAQASRWQHVVLLGMGGSSLAPEMLARTFAPRSGFPQMHILDSTNPASVRAVDAAVDLPKTLFVVASKSGTTIETRAFLNHFYERTARNGRQFMAITDEGSPLAELAQKAGFFDAFLNPPDIGGSYSALSYFGMVPAALLGLDLERLWASAENMLRACGPRVGGFDHPGIWLGAILGTLAEEGRDKASIFTSPSIAHFGPWAEQLLAESTGKDERGLIPVVGATVGNPHDYVTDRVFIYLRVDGDDNDEIDQGLAALQQASQPCVTLRLPDQYAIAGEFFRWEFAAVVAAHILKTNPFDAPAILDSKQNTVRLMQYYQQDGALPRLQPALTEGNVSLYADDKMLRLLSELSIQQEYSSSDLTGLLASQINSTRAGDYFALLAYLPRTPEIEDVLDVIRRRLRHTTHRAVTVDYGPRYLHSTGQLHKGGPNKGVFFIITSDDPHDIDIPGLSFSFGTLHAAQALGDLEALQHQRRRVLRLHISGDIVSGLEKLLVAIDAVGERRR